MKFLLAFGVFILSFFIFVPSTQAALECQAGDLRALRDADSSAQRFDAVACIGGFASRELAMQPMTIIVQCLTPSSAEGSPFGCILADWLGTDRQTYTITPSHIAERDIDGDGRIDDYFTCYEIIDIDRGVGRFNVTFETTSGSCTTDPVDSIPENYDFWYEAIRVPIEGIRDPIIKSPICVDGSVNTAFGCIDINPVAFTRFLLGWSLGVGGGIALVLIGFAGIKLMLSMGNPDQVNDAKSMLVAAISGLLLIIFSTFLLRLIGVNILELF